MLGLWGVIKGLLVKGESDRSKQVSLEIDNGATTNTRTTIRASQTANRTLDLPDATDTLVGRATTDTLSNKTLDNSNAVTLEDSSFTLQDDADNTKQAQFNLSSLTTATTRTLSLPDANDTLAGIAATQTLTNKTIDATGTGTNTISIDADSVNYDNGVSGLSATDVQAALDEIDSNVDSVAANKLEGPGTHADNLLLKTDGVDTNAMQVTGISIDDLNSITGILDLTTTGDVTIGGDLQVNGTLTSVNSATLEVTDANVIVNNGGNQASANSQGAGFTVEMSDATDAAVSYDSTLATKFKVGEIGSQVEVVGTSSTQTLTNKTIDANSNTISNLAHGSEVDNPSSGVHGVTGNVVGTSDAQVLTNKDIDGGTASNTSRITIPKDTKTNLDALTRKEGTIVYASDLDSFYGDDGSQLFEIGSGGEGGKNYFEGGNFEGGISLASTYDDGSAYVDGTGGTPSFISIAQNSSSPLAGGRDLAITKAIGDATDEGVSFLSQTIDRADRGKDLFLEFEYDFSDADYVSGDVQIKAYDVTNAVILPVVPIANLDDNAGLFEAKSKAYAKVLCGSTTAQVRVSLHVETDSNTGANWTGYVDDIKLGPSGVLVGSVITEWQSYTPSGSWSSFGTYTGRYRRVGDSMEIEASWLFSSTPSGNFDISLPSGFTIDTTKVAQPNTNAEGSILGFAKAFDAGVGSHVGVVTYTSTTTVRVQGDDGSSLWTPTVPITFAAGEAININFKVPISQWSSGNLLSANEVVYSTAFVRGQGNAGTALTADVTNIDFTEITDSFNAWNGSVFTAPISGDYLFIGNAVYNAAYSGGVNLYVNGVFRDQAGHSNGNTRAKLNVIARLNAGDTASFRNGTSATLSNTTTHGLVIKALPDFSTFGVYSNTSLQEAGSGLISYPIAVNAWGDLTSLTLPAGEWDLDGSVSFNSNGATTTTDVRISISLSSGSSIDPGAVFGRDYVETQKATASGSTTVLHYVRRGLVLSAPTLVYLKAAADNSVTNLRVAYKITARKVR